MYKHILIPTDGSQLSADALDKGMTFAKEIGAKVTVVTVTEPFHLFSLDPAQVVDTPSDYRQHVRERARRHLAAAGDKAKALGIPCETVQVEHEHPYEVIIQTAANRDCDLIAMASHGRRGVSAVVLGSETVKVLTHSKTPVLVYR
ncbi:universal stress protein [Chelatococcus sp. SYSU_G07232]|uniref:Universal stress protein n=1 Tax=Chelatococcus albus TaxID=3047466 RepID=A0ABT7ADI5_9HYPH|nr:universal stress protein [Chelatococcus sp. SYSU_G07232]MDJ1156686.1 universal stress protein [Chelatococcus sp. SYSU_G07232]